MLDKPTKVPEEEEMAGEGVEGVEVVAEAEDEEEAEARLSHLFLTAFQQRACMSTLKIVFGRAWSTRNWIFSKSYSKEGQEEHHGEASMRSWTKWCVLGVRV
jgi:hypothetical protein